MEEGALCSSPGSHSQGTCDVVSDGLYVWHCQCGTALCVYACAARLSCLVLRPSACRRGMHATPKPTDQLSLSTCWAMQVDEEELDTSTAANISAAGLSSRAKGTVGRGMELQGSEPQDSSQKLRHGDFSDAAGL